MTKSMLQSLVIASGSIALMAFVLSLARSGRLAFRYTVGWLGLMAVGVLFAVAADLVEPLGNLLGVTPGVIVTGTGILMLVLICIQLSVSISGLQNRIRILSEEAALLRFKLNQEKNEPT